MNTGRIASAALALIYLVAAYIGGGGEALLKTVIFLTLPLACIWFSDELGAFTGVMRGQHINATTPGFLVALGGWLILMIPLVIGIINFFRGPS